MLLIDQYLVFYRPVSLCDCPLYPNDMQQLLHRLERFIQQAGIPPYRIDKAKGELKVYFAD